VRKVKVEEVMLAEEVKVCLAERRNMRGAAQVALVLLLVMTGNLGQSTL
jgi:hypothetical protein